ncbi:hypothetical protein V6N13_132993 [Hibiscus sabdariffa]
MDGFLIKVFLERKVSDQVNAAGGEKQKGKQLESHRKNMSSKLDGRTFKEALLGNSHKKDKGDDPKKLPILGHRAAFSDHRQSGEDDSNINNVELQSQSQFQKLSLAGSKDIDNLDNFMNKKKLRVWVCVHGMPLMAWQETVFTALGSQWGRVVRLDVDTVNKSRLDVARILLGAYSTRSYNDTPRASIIGKASGVGAKTVGTEGELKWDQSGGRNF